MNPTQKAAFSSRRGGSSGMEAQKIAGATVETTGSSGASLPRSQAALNLIINKICTLKRLLK